MILSGVNVALSETSSYNAKILGVVFDRQLCSFLLCVSQRAVDRAVKLDFPNSSRSSNAWAIAKPTM